MSVPFCGSRAQKNSEKQKNLSIPGAYLLSVARSIFANLRCRFRRWWVDRRLTIITPHRYPACRVAVLPARHRPERHHQAAVAEIRRQMRLRMRADDLPLAATEAAVENVKNPFPGDFTSCCTHTEKIEQRSKLQHVDVLGHAPRVLLDWFPVLMQMQGTEQAGRTHESPNSWASGRPNRNDRPIVTKTSGAPALGPVAWSPAGLQAPGRCSLGRVLAPAGAWNQTAVNRAMQSTRKVR